MIIQIDQTNRHEMTALLDECYRLRHDIFVDEMKWEDLRRPDGREIDQFDLPEAVEFAYLLDGRLVAYSRLLPTTGPHLLADVFPYLCDGESPRGPDIWEWSRYAIRKDVRGAGSAPSAITIALATRLVEWGMANGVRSIVAEMNPIQLLRYVQCHFRAHPLGITHPVAGAETMAIRADFDERTLARLRTIRTGADRRARAAAA